MDVNRTVYALSMTTPDFAPWAGAFARQLQRHTRCAALHQLELLFECRIAHWLLAQQDEGPHSRNRHWNLRLVFWTFLWQVAQAGASCREAIRQAQARCRINGQAGPADTTSPYCQARASLPLERLDQIHHHLTAQADKSIASADLWCGRRVLVADGTTVTAPDTPENQQVYPQQSVQRPGCGFPIIRIVALLSLATGMLVGWATGNWHHHEVPLLQTLWDYLLPGDVLLADRGFPPARLAELYYRRWSMELTLRHLKITLQMDQLSCKTPANLEREIRMHFLVHNLVRQLMLEAARRHHAPLQRLSFAGALATARRYAEALLQARSENQRRLLREELFRVLAADRVPDRPGRREPRAVKRRPKPYPLLMNHRHRFLEIPHQNKYRKISTP